MAFPFLREFRTVSFPLVSATISAVCAIISLTCTIIGLHRSSQTMRPALLFTVHGFSHDEPQGSFMQWLIYVTNRGGGDAFDVRMHTEDHGEDRLISPCIRVGQTYSMLADMRFDPSIGGRMEERRVVIVSWRCADGHKGIMEKPIRDMEEPHGRFVTRFDPV